MTPEDRQAFAFVIAEMREVIAERLLCNISQQKGRVVAKETLERWLALLLAEAHQHQEKKDVTRSAETDVIREVPLPQRED